MRIKRFEAYNVEEALNKVRAEFGEDAVILSTRTIKRGGGTFGIFGRSIIEVTAAIDDERRKDHEGVFRERPPIPEEGERRDDKFRGVWEVRKAIEPLHDEIKGLKEMITNLNRIHRTSQDARDRGELEENIDEIRDMLKEIAVDRHPIRVPELHPSLKGLYQTLVKNGVEERLTGKLIEEVSTKIPCDKLSEEGYAESYLKRVLMRLMPISGELELMDGQAKTVAFVGPTGVGKTTTIAKLAAEYSLEKKKKVALVTIDTYRIAAVEQLKIYSRIIGIPVSVVLTPADLKDTLDYYSNKDLIFIDTAGRSQYNELQMSELAEFFDHDSLIETHLVLSTVARDQDLIDTYRRFEVAKINHLVFTKIDESKVFGNIFNTLIYSGKPISYLSNGQRVPEDIEEATPQLLTDMILNGR